jgi:hypothetical protein
MAAEAGSRTYTHVSFLNIQHHCSLACQLCTSYRHQTGMQCVHSQGFSCVVCAAAVDALPVGAATGSQPIPSSGASVLE